MKENEFFFNPTRCNNKSQMCGFGGHTMCAYKKRPPWTNGGAREEEENGEKRGPMSPNEDFGANVVR